MYKSVHIIWHFVRKYGGIIKVYQANCVFLSSSDLTRMQQHPNTKFWRKFLCYLLLLLPFLLLLLDIVQCFRLPKKKQKPVHSRWLIHTNMATSTKFNITLLINDYQFNINSISMYYNQTILNSDRYSLYITILKSDNNMTTEALKHYKGAREMGQWIEKKK